MRREVRNGEAAVPGSHMGRAPSGAAGCFAEIWRTGTLAMAAPPVRTPSEGRGILNSITACAGRRPRPRRGCNIPPNGSPPRGRRATLSRRNPAAQALLALRARQSPNLNLFLPPGRSGETPILGGGRGEAAGRRKGAGTWHGGNGPTNRGRRRAAWRNLGKARDKWRPRGRTGG